MAIERASCPVLNTLRFCTKNSSKLYNFPRKHLQFPSFFPRNFNSINGKLYTHGLFLNSSSSFSNTTQETPSQKLALLLEVEGVLMDVDRLGNRQAFNTAFRKLGLDCANWSQPVYQDLVKYDVYEIGWPTSLPTSEKETFMKTVLREKWLMVIIELQIDVRTQNNITDKRIALDELVMSKTLPLRPGVEEFIDEACEEGVPVVMLTAYCKSGEKQYFPFYPTSVILLHLPVKKPVLVSSHKKLGCFDVKESAYILPIIGKVTSSLIHYRSIIEKLGNDKMAKIKIIGTEEVKRSAYGQLVLGEGVASDLGEQLAKEARKAVSAEEQRIAKEVASILKLTVDIDTTSSEGLQNVVAALRAGAEYADVPVHNCVLVSGSLSGVAGAERIGMSCVVVRSSSTARAEFPGAKAIMDGFGGADLTISRLRQIQES
uniref:Uncharacterized protein n=1 Tax=Solanum lycopersicum TaxID=4081 RepID=A0A3Q7F1W9_SOLLC